MLTEECLKAQGWNSYSMPIFNTLLIVQNGLAESKVIKFPCGPEFSVGPGEEDKK